MQEAKVGIGGAPTRCTTLPTDSASRKTFPIASGFTDYFPDAIAAVSNLSYTANEQHHAGSPIHWERAKSTDEADTLMRHFLQRGSLDTDGKRHSAKLAWRALALLQKEIEGEKKYMTREERITFFAAPPASRVEIKDGPYCDSCEVLAELRSPHGVYFCRACVPSSWHLKDFTVLDGGKL